MIETQINDFRRFEVHINQVKFLEKHGIDAEDISCQGYASKMISTIKAREASGLSSAKQIRKLTQYGFKNVPNWTSEQASKMIVRIQSSKWRVPRGVDPSTYIPK